MADEQLNLEEILAEDDKKGPDVVIDIAPKKDDAQNKGPSDSETIEALKAQIADRDRVIRSERERAAALETENLDVKTKVVTASQDAVQSRDMAIENAITASKADLATIKQSLKAARTSGDIDAEIELEEKLADVKYRLNAAEWQKDNAAKIKADNEKLAKSQPVQQPRQGHSPKVQEWIAQHPRWNDDDEYQAFATAMHTVAIKKGYQPESEAYFEFINGKLDKQFPDEDKTRREEPRQQTLTTAAPPSRTSDTSGRLGANGTKVRLTADQIEAAEFMGMTPAEYAADLIKQEEEKRGR